MSHRKTLWICSAIFLLFVAACSRDKAKDDNSAAAVRDSVREVTYSPRSLADEPNIDSVLAVDEQPMPVKTVNPAYPEDARKSGVEGTVWVKALIDRKGMVKRAVVIKRNGIESFEEATLGAVKKWEFKPAVVKGESVDVWVAIPFRFKLQQK